MARYVKLLLDKSISDGFNGLINTTELEVFSNGVNIALNKPVTVTSVYGPFQGAFLVNGDKSNTCWSGWSTGDGTGGNPMGSQYAIIDLQSNYFIEKIIVYFPNEYGHVPATDYRISFSNDGLDYWLAATITDKPNIARVDTINELNNGFYSLYKIGNIVYGVRNGVFEQMSTNWDLLTGEEQENLFKLTNYKNANANDLTNLNIFTVLKYQESSTQTGCTVTAVPKDQLILPKGLFNIESFEGIDKVSLASNITNNGVVKLLITNDLINYQTYDFVNKAWENIDHIDLLEVLAQGISASDIPNITRDSWDILINNKSGIGFAYLIKMEDATDVCEVDKINLTVDMKGTWEKSTHGSDYKYGYPSNKTLRLKLLASGDYKINYSEGSKNP